ncbi:hypothetical protein ACSETL_34740 [Pseudomonas aeruginosa]
MTEKAKAVTAVSNLLNGGKASDKIGPTKPVPGADKPALKPFQGKGGKGGPPYGGADTGFGYVEEEHDEVKLAWARAEYLLNTKLGRDFDSVFKTAPRNNATAQDVERWIADNDGQITNLLNKVYRDPVVSRLRPRTGGGGHLDPFYAALASACEASNHHSLVNALGDGQHWMKGIHLNPRDLKELREWASWVSK